MKSGSARIAIAALLALVAPPSEADARTDYPSHAVRIVIPYPPGGATGIFAHLLAPELSAALGQPVFVENKPGASSNIGTEYVARAAPDGYTLLLGSMSSVVINRNVYHLPLDPLRHLVPVILVATAPSVLYVNSSVPARTFAQFVERVKRSPGRFSFSTPGLGSLQHLGGEMLNEAFGLDLLNVPYSGSGPAVAAVAAGQVPAGIDSPMALKPFLDAKRVRALAILGPARAITLPDLPTMAELGAPQVDAVSWYAVFAPEGTPRPIVERVNRELRRILLQPAMRKRFADLGSDVAPGNVDEFGRFVAREARRWEARIRDLRAELHCDREGTSTACAGLVSAGIR